MTTEHENIFLFWFEHHLATYFLDLFYKGKCSKIDREIEDFSKLDFPETFSFLSMILEFICQIY